MRRFLFILFFVLCLSFTSGAEARKLALLVGVDEYEDIQSLRCCVNDMKILRQALIKIGFRNDNIHILVTGSAYKYLPTKKKIEQKLSEILSMAQPNDLVLIAFSGHGAQNGKNVYFCPPDTDLNDLDGTCISITKVMDDLAKCPAKFKWMVVDACRNNPTSTRAAKSLQVVPAPPSGIALFQSCAKGELSYEERRAGGNGYFTKNFAAALSGEADSNRDGRLTLFEVCDWTADHTKSDVMKAEKATQRPYFSGSIPNYTIIENRNFPKAKELALAARAAMDKEDFDLAVKKYNEALALCPNYTPWKRDRDLAMRLRNSKPKYNPENISVPDDFATIEEAYKNVKDGGIITIQTGRYEISKTLVVTRSVTFRGITGRPEDIVIDCPSSHVFQITSGSPSFQNFTASSGGEKCGGFYVTGGTPKLFRCIITSRKGCGMYVHGENANPQVESCILKNCGQYGLNVYKSGLGKFSDCEIFRNANAGIQVKMSGNPIVIGCIIHDGNQEGVKVSENGLGSFTDCNIYENALSGIDVRSAGNPTVLGCKIHNNKEAGMWIHENGRGKFSNCDIYGNKLSGIEIKDYSNPIVIGCKIHNDGQNGVFVWKNSLGMFNSCDIYGNTFPEICVKEAGNPTFTGCKIYDGQNNGVWVGEKGLGKFINCFIFRNTLAGIAVLKSGNPTFTGCKIFDGKNSGVFITNNGLGTFSNCEIYGNAMAGIEVKLSGNPTVTGCIIHDGKQAGVFVNENGLGSFTDCDIYRNTFSGIEVITSGNPTVTRCKIHDGKENGVYIHDNGRGTFNNNTLERNFLNGQLSNWNILSGSANGFGNNPAIPSQSRNYYTPAQSGKYYYPSQPDNYYYPSDSDDYYYYYDD